MPLKLPCRSLTQITLSSATLLTSVVAFIFILLFRNQLNTLSSNLTETPSNNYYPCIRQTLDTCSDSDTCYDRCCPVGYLCSISPVVGLFCQHGDQNCLPDGSGTASSGFCRDLADISGQCLTETCSSHHLVLSMVLVAFILSGLGVFLDFADLLAYFIAPDAVKLKSGVNFVAAVFKIAAVVGLLGSKALDFTRDLVEKRCFVTAASSVLEKAVSMLVGYLVVGGLSGVFGLFLAPISAFWGGKLVGVPFVST